jgi:N-acetylglucosaminyl-diphospho-decaprenol L-rhamnosyltransferase
MDLSVVIVEYLDLASLREAISSIRGNIGQLETEVIVVSNSAYPGSIQAEIRRDFLGVRLIFNQNNRGFAAGVNQGLALAQGEFVLLLNPDARLLDESIVHALELFRANPRVAVVGPLILDRSGKIQDSCRRFLSLGILLQRTAKRILHRGNVPIPEEIDYNLSQKVDWVCGACLLVRHSAIADIGPLDERFLMYMEDMDWCRRFWQKGWEVWFQPLWKVEHNAGRGSTSRFRLTNKLLWLHLASLSKYLVKWGFKTPRTR